MSFEVFINADNTAEKYALIYADPAHIGDSDRRTVSRTDSVFVGTGVLYLGSELGSNVTALDTGNIIVSLLGDRFEKLRRGKLGAVMPQVRKPRTLAAATRASRKRPPLRELLIRHDSKLRRIRHGAGRSDSVSPVNLGRCSTGPHEGAKARFDIGARQLAQNQIIIPILGGPYIAGPDGAGAQPSRQR